MKKKWVLLLAAIAAVVLAACGGTSESAESSSESGISMEEVLAGFSPDYDKDQTLAVNNANLYGMCLVEDNVFYGRYWTEADDYYQFVRMELVPDPDYPDYITSGDWSILVKDVVPKFINKVDDTLYYVEEDWTQGDDPVTCIARVSADGQNRTKLADGKDWLTVRDGRLYFTDMNDRYVSTDLEGGDQQVILDTKVFYPFFVNDDWIIYQNDPDNESLHLYNISSGVDLKLNDEPSYFPVLHGQYLYFRTKAEQQDWENTAYNLCRIDLAGWSVSSDGGSDTVTFPCEKSEKLCGGDFQITWNEAYQDMTLNGMNNANGVTLGNWDQYEDNGYEKVTQQYLYLSDPVNVYVEYNDEGARAFMFTNNETGYSQSIHSLR